MEAYGVFVADRLVIEKSGEYKIFTDKEAALVYAGEYSKKRPDMFVTVGVVKVVSITRLEDRETIY